MESPDKVILFGVRPLGFVALTQDLDFIERLDLLVIERLDDLLVIERLGDLLVKD